MTKIIDRRKQSMGGNDKRAINRISNIAVHYSATAEGNTASFERYWKNSRGWNTGGYHEVVLVNGDVELNYDPDTISNGVLNHNSVIYNICYVGAGKPNSKQLAALTERVNYNLKRFNITANNVKGHREFSGQSTACPALDMNEFRKSLTSTSTSTTKPAPTPSKPKSKTIAQMADEVIAGKHGNGHANRRKSLGISQAEYDKVRAEVNRKAGTTHKPEPKKSITQMATEVIAGKHGNGHDARRKSLGISQTEYNKVRAEVNKRAGGGSSSAPKKSINQMATEVIQGKHGNGHANRRKSLGISQSEYNKVRAEVNRRL